MFDMVFYKGKKVLVTGHTGFKGTWLCKMLIDAGAEVTGYALEAPTDPAVFEIGHFRKCMDSVIGDVRDYFHLQRVFDRRKPEIVLHLAAQPIVKEGYERPRYTYEVNVMGTVNLLECVRKTESVKSVINVTSDKVYQNSEWDWGYRENDPLDGYDPYSNSKSCSELVTKSYKRAYFGSNDCAAVSTLRAGNVIGGGDFGRDRIIPDCIRHVMKGENILVRNPYSIRPYQHVLESLYVYLMVAALQYDNRKYIGNYNVGPNENDSCTTGQLVQMFLDSWGGEFGWFSSDNNGPHEANYLKLDCSKLKNIFNWQPRWNIQRAIDKTVEWTKCWMYHGDICKCMQKQIEEYLTERQI